MPPTTAHQPDRIVISLLTLCFITSISPTLLKQTPTFLWGMGQWQQKNNNQQYCWSLITNFGQQHLNGTADWFAAEDGQVLPHFQQIVNGALMLPCPIKTVFNSSASGRLVSWSVGRSVSRSVCWSVGWLVGWSVSWLVSWLVSRSTIRIPGLWKVSLRKDDKDLYRI